MSLLRTEKMKEFWLVIVMQDDAEPLLKLYDNYMAAYEQVLKLKEIGEKFPSLEGFRNAKTVKLTQS
jgi:hypothetical protein